MSQQQMRPPPVPGTNKHQKKPPPYPGYPSPGVPPPRNPRRRQKAPQPVQNLIPPPPPPPAPPPVSPQPAPPLAFLNEPQILAQLLNGLAEDKLDLFFRVFEFPYTGKRREEKLEPFIAHFLPRLLKLNPNAITYLHFFIEHLRSSPDVCAKFRDLQLPIFFTRIKGYKPIFKFFPLNSQGFDLFPNQKERKPDPWTLGSWVTVGDSPPTCSLYLDKAEVAPATFGGNEAFYLITTESRSPAKMHIQFQTHPSNFLTWFVIQYVDRRQLLDVFNDLALSIPGATDKTLFAKTPYCKGCSFLVATAIVELGATGSGRCPTCGAPITLTELTYEIKQVEAPAMPFVATPPPRLEDQEMHKVRLTLAEHLAVNLKVPTDPRLWAGSMFREPQEWDAAPGLMKYDNTEEFLSVIEHMK